MVCKMMFRTKDNRIVIMDMPADGTMLRAKSIEYKNYFAQHNYSDSLRADYASNFDEKNSEFVNEQVHSFSYQKQPEKYHNTTDDSTIPVGTAMLLPGTSYAVSDVDIPAEVKNLGYTIEPYDVEWKIKLEGDEYKLYNKKDNTPYNPTRASVDSGKRCITVWRHHYDMDSDTLRSLLSLIDRFQRSGQTGQQFGATLSGKEKSLFKLYDDEKTWNETLKLTLHHEFKHIKNQMFIDTVYLNRADKRLSVNDTYRLEVEDERSASLSSLINEINEYLKRGQWDNLDCFKHEDSKWLVERLQNMPVDQRKNFLQKPANYVNEAAVKWLEYHQEDYDANQFGAHYEDGKNRSGTVIDLINKTPMNLPEDEQDLSATYKKIRKQLYHFAVYNPDTGKFEQKYLDKYIDDSLDVISEDARTSIIPAAQTRLNERQQKYDQKISAGADASLIEPARKFMRQGVSSAQCVAPENLYIESLDADYIARQGISCENAGWSNHLQSYYQHQSNYTEIAKNDEEYVFKLGNDVVRYTDKSTLAVNQNAQFATYMQVLAEPSNKNTTINFMPNLSNEQALMLYAACIACGRKMRGNVPTDLSGLDRLQGIPPQTMNLINQRLRRTSTASTPTPVASRSICSLRGGRSGR